MFSLKTITPKMARFFSLASDTEAPTQHRPDTNYVTHYPQQRANKMSPCPYLGASHQRPGPCRFGP